MEKVELMGSSLSVSVCRQSETGVGLIIGRSLYEFSPTDAERIADALYKMARAIERGKVEDKDEQA